MKAVESSAAFPRLFSPIAIRGVEIKNRIVFLPHLPFYADHHHHPTTKDTYYYRERAKGGAGLIVLPTQIVHPTGSYPGAVDAFDKASIAGWEKIITEVHRYGARIFGQLSHMGNQTRSAEIFRPTWAPSPIPDMTVGEIPKEMTREEIQELVESFAASAENMVEAGFDGIEIKVAHDGILGQFVSLLKNQRNDEYGGSIENRGRIVVEILHAIRNKIGEKPLGVRLGINRYLPGDYGVEEAVEYAKLFTTVADYLSTDTGTWESIDMLVPSMNVPQGFLLKDVARIKEATGATIIGHGRIVWPATAEDALEKGYLDMVGMARALISDPYWAKKAEAGKPEEIRGCLGCNQKCMGRLLQNLPISCVHNPTSGYEEEYGEDILYQKMAVPKKMVIVGGGPAGMKAAEIFARKGNKVILFEKEEKLGGRVYWESSLPGRRGISGVSRYLIHMLGTLDNIDIRLNTEATRETVLEENPDVVIIATGSAVISPSPMFYNTLDALKGQVPGENILVMDNDSTTEGSGIVELFIKEGKIVHWVTPAFFNGQNITAPILLDNFKRLSNKDNLFLHPMKVMTDFKEGAVTLLNIYLGTTEEIRGIDSVVVAGVKAPNNSLYYELKESVPEIYIIGDAAAPRDIASALEDAVGLTKLIK